MPRYTISLLAIVAFLGNHCQNPAPQKTPSTDLDETGRPVFYAHYGTPILDGSGADDVWTLGDWQPIDQLWAGSQPSETDFSGQYKLAWDENNLYVLVEIIDDSLLDIHADGLKKYWDDDCLEVFIDEDGSGGNHQYNYNAFAYHIALDGRVVDIARDSSYQFFDEHCISRRITRDEVSTWELAIRLYDGMTYIDDGENVPKLLTSGKEIGFAIAYCDNDQSPEREHFMGSVPIPGEDKNRAWIDAGLFGKLELHQH